MPWSSFFSHSKYFKEEIIAAKKRGVRLRLMTLIDKNNIETAKKPSMEIKHAANDGTCMICFDRHNLILIKDSENEEAISFSGANLITGMKACLRRAGRNGKEPREKGS